MLPLNKGLMSERLESPAKGLEGTVRNAKHSGFKSVQNHWVTYDLIDQFALGFTIC